ncbi:FecR/PupR family sigma factor regulator [Asaia astilbis]|uniref:FecR/PupR family sigma factor regulator n=1 Tax=Asaia astilbis TaxID=610244 RepID=UPI000559CDEA|nr:DUF4880 domain-containing protein [Asaia astilbis]
MTPELVEKAAFWQARLLSDQCSDRDRAQFTTWLGESDAHHQAYGLSHRSGRRTAFPDLSAVVRFPAATLLLEPPSLVWVLSSRQRALMRALSVPGGTNVAGSILVI